MLGSLCSRAQEARQALLPESGGQREFCRLTLSGCCRGSGVRASGRLAGAREEPEGVLAGRAGPVWCVSAWPVSTGLPMLSVKRAHLKTSDDTRLGNPGISRRLSFFQAQHPSFAAWLQ